ncbi:MAG: IS200/IS605 family transposase [Bacteroidales bacterium]|nr:IS200/IS605 family transposase [Candidatus Physcousia equi]
MANTYTQIYMHVIFAVKGRESLIRPEWQDELYRYMSGALKNHEHTPYIINGMEDHVHLLFGMTPKESLSELVQSLKIQTTKHIKEKYCRRDFSWQSGFWAFSYSKSFLPAVSHYIENQKEHHKKYSFDDEMREILEKAGIEYDERYILKGVI